MVQIFILQFLLFSIIVHVHIVQVYRVSDLEVVSMLPSAEDEVNVACFHPLAGGGLAYGTKVRARICLYLFSPLKIMNVSMQIHCVINCRKVGLECWSAIELTIIRFLLDQILYHLKT